MVRRPAHELHHQLAMKLPPGDYMTSYDDLNISPQKELLREALFWWVTDRLTLPMDNLIDDLVRGANG